MEDPRDRKEAIASFDYAGPETEAVLMGNLAIRLQQLNRNGKSSVQRRLPMNG